MVLVSLPARVSLAARCLGHWRPGLGLCFSYKVGGWGMAAVFTQRWLLCFKDKRGETTLQSFSRDLATGQARRAVNKKSCL